MNFRKIIDNNNRQLINMKTFLVYKHNTSVNIPVIQCLTNRKTFLNFEERIFVMGRYILRSSKTYEHCARVSILFPGHPICYQKYPCNELNKLNHT